jgi:hypothetical protein
VAAARALALAHRELPRCRRIARPLPSALEPWTAECRRWRAQACEQGFDFDGLLEARLAAPDPASVLDPEGAEPLSDEEVARFMAVHRARNPHLSDEHFEDLELDLRALPVPEPPADQLAERASRMEARAGLPGEEWVAPYARAVPARADRQRGSGLRALSVRSVAPVASSRARAREPSSPPSSRSTSGVRSGRDPPKRRPSSGSAGGSAADDDDSPAVAAPGAASRR